VVKIMLHTIIVYRTSVNQSKTCICCCLHKEEAAEAVEVAEEEAHADLDDLHSQVHNTMQ
jgi:hypothetical protein